MSNVDNIEAAVKQLSGPELRRFRSWFAKFDGKNWDAQIERDASAGKLDALAEEAISEYEAGKAKEL